MQHRRVATYVRLESSFLTLNQLLGKLKQQNGTGMLQERPMSLPCLSGDTENRSLLSRVLKKHDQVRKKAKAHQ